MSDMTNYAIKVTIAAIIAAILMPVAIGLIVNATIPNADSTVILVLKTLLPILLVLGLAIAFMPPEMKSRVGLWATPYEPALPTEYTYAEDTPKTIQTEILSVSNFEAIG